MQYIAITFFILAAETAKFPVNLPRQGEFGFAILDDKGKQIGIWYSIMIPGISIKMLDDRKVIIYPPSDSNYTCYDDQY